MSDLAEFYERWARLEARGSSPTYERWALAVAADPELLALIASLPPVKRQPNLVFAAARWHGVPFGVDSINDWLRDHWELVESTVRARSTQTNEAARCAPLLVALSMIDGPISLIEVGAAAGLCLIPDRYAYRLRSGDDQIELSPREPTDEASILIECAVSGTLPQLRMPEIVWRVGIDPHPVDLTIDEEGTWMETLIWPEHEERRMRFRAASTILRRDPPRLEPGGIESSLASVASDAPADASLVIVHSAVLAYLDVDARTHAHRVMGDSAQHVIGLEGLSVMSSLGIDVRHLEAGTEGDFLLTMDGEALGFAHPHGGRYTSLVE